MKTKKKIIKTKWEKEFDNILPTSLIIDGYECDLLPAVKNLKPFIRKLLLLQKQEIMKEIEKMLKDVEDGYDGGNVILFHFKKGLNQLNQTLTK